MAGALCIAALAGCAHSEQAKGYWGKAEPSGFLNDYSKLRPAADDTEGDFGVFHGGQDQVQILHEGLGSRCRSGAGKSLMQRIWMWRMPTTCPNSSGQSSMKNPQGLSDGAVARA